MFYDNLGIPLSMVKRQDFFLRPLCVESIVSFYTALETLIYVNDDFMVGFSLVQSSTDYMSCYRVCLSVGSLGIYSVCISFYSVFLFSLCFNIFLIAQY